jgi:hypothetical protein
VKRLKELETENSRLRRAVSDLTLDKLILTEAAKGNFFSIRAHDASSLLQTHGGGDHPARLLLLSEVSVGCLMMGSEGTGGAI